MGLFKPDLYRSFVAGFLLGAAVLGASLTGDARAEIVASIAPAALR